MNKTLKYLISLFLAFVMIASDCTLVSQSKSADYYQSSFVILRRELDFKNSSFFLFNKLRTFEKVGFSIPLIFLQFKVVCNVQIRVLLQLQKLLHQNINSFIKQSVFVNEIITSNNLYKSLYSA